MSVLSVESVAEVHRWGDLEPARTDYDMRVAGQRVTLTPPSAAVPAFEACAACPSCEHLAVHPWREPHIIPPKEILIRAGRTAVEVLGRLDAAKVAVRATRAPRGWKVLAYFVGDESRFSVVRQCGECSYEWGQA